jgi:uncharacterized membrane-anchored protein YhcB (DUF1043 family)
MEDPKSIQDKDPDEASPASRTTIANGGALPTGNAESLPALDAAVAPEAPNAAESQGSRQSPSLPSRTTLDLPFTRQEQVGLLFGANLVTLIVSIILTLSILSLVNNGLSFTSSSQLKREIDALKTQASVLQQNITSLNNRLEKMDSTSGKLSTMETESQSLRADLAARSKEILDLQEQMSNLSSRLKSQEARTLSFEKFLEGLRALLNGSN